MRFTRSSNPTTALPTVLAAICTATLATSALADRIPGPANSISAEGLGTVLTDDGAGITENFETFTLGAGCTQNGWTGFCDPGPPPAGFLIVDDPAATFGTRSARHVSDGSNVTGFEMVGPLQTNAQFGLLAVDVYISNTASLYQLITGANTSGTTVTFNTRINFEANGTITALQTSDCATGAFSATTGTWAPNTILRLGIEVTAGGGPGSLKLYKDGTLIFTGRDIVGQCAPASPQQGIQQIRNWAANATGTGQTSFQTIDNISESNGNACAAPLPPCRTDVANNDGQTNVADLLAVISTWGQNGNPNGPRPQGDCHPLPNGDCIVNVGDLLAVIGAWGPCPVPTGACCLPNGSCAQNLTQANCTSQGGTYLGDGSTTCPGCAPTPANDNCPGAITVNDGATNIDNTGATDSAGIPGGACIFGGAANIHRDIWYKYTATCNGNVTVDLCATTGSVTDTTLQVYSGTCAALTEVACDDDACTGNPAGDRSRATFAATQGTQYLIRVGTWGTNAPGPMVLTIGCTVFNNDFCSDATPVGALPATINGNIVGATADNAPVCNGVTMSKGRWYTVVGNGNTLTANLCNSPFELWDSRLSVYCGGSCASLFCVAAADDTCGAHSQVSWCSAPGQLYYIVVHTPDLVSNPEGNYVLNVTSGAACGNPTSCGPPNDGCANAQDVTANIGGAAVSGNNVGASPPNATGGADPELPAGSPTCHWNGQPQAVYATLWYKFTAPASGRIDITICGSTGTFNDSSLVLYSGNCGSLVEVTCGEDECGGPTWYSHISNLNLTPGQVYRFMIGCSGALAGDVSIPGDFSFVISEPPAASCPPVLPATGCTNQIGGNGPFDPAATGANGTRPSAGWANGELGVMEDLVFCNAGGGTINQLKVQFLDQIAAGAGTLSTYNTIRVRIYNLNNQPISALAPATAVPLFSQDFVVGTNATKALCGTIGFGLDAECWTLTVPNWHLAQGSYGVYFSFPQLTNAAAPSVFIATGSPPTCTGCTPNDSSPQNVYIWGMNAGAPVNAPTTQHSSFCVGGTVP